MVVSRVKVLLPEPAPPPGGVETGFDEKANTDPGTKPERVSRYAVFAAIERPTE